MAEIPKAKVLVTITLEVLEGRHVFVRIESPTQDTEVDNIVAAVSALAGMVAKHLGESEEEVLQRILGFQHNIRMNGSEN